MTDWLLLTLAFLVPAIYGCARSIDHGRIRIDHVTLFSLGFIFYWVTPMVAGFLIDANDMPTTFTMFFDTQWTRSYLIAIIATYFAFIAGDRFGEWAFSGRQIRGQVWTQGRNEALSPQLLALFSGAAFLVFLLEIIVHRVELFAPYSTDMGGQVSRGNVTAWVVLLGSVVFLRISSRPRFTVLILPFAVGALFLVLIGSRLYVASFVLMFAAFRSLYVVPFSKKQVAFAGLFIVALFGIVGALRVNSSIMDAGFNVLLEPLLTSISLVYFLRYDHMAWLAAPKYLISDFCNLLPSAIFPGKAALIHTPEIFSPLGALHSFVSFNFNFGLIGTAAFMFLLPVSLRWIKARDNSPLYRTMYVMLSGWLAFTFFRDGFSVSIVKDMVQHSILLPMAVVVFVRLAELASQSILSTGAYPTPDQPDPGQILKASTSAVE
jgi:hypothetical protein